ncbi:MAG: hypothetical protein KBG15_12335 [Kofleriaceae bacterium]|nr:hypothetical protein [Kofleriaceae bacterium]
MVTFSCGIGSRAAWAGIVAIACEGEVPERAVATLQELTTALDGLGMTAAPAAIAIALGQAAPLAAVSDPTVTTKDLFVQIESGYSLWLRGEFAAAEAQLNAAMRAVGRNPGTVVADAAFRSAITRGLVGLALSRKRRKQAAGAVEAMTELIRSLPEQPVTTAEFGPEAERFYQQIRRNLDSAPRGRLIVDVTRSNAQIFINEQGRAKGAAFSADMLPGRYRIMVQVAGEARRYVVVIRGNAETRLLIDWDASQYVHSTPAGLMVKLPRGTSAAAGAVTRRFLQAAGHHVGTFVVLAVTPTATGLTLVGSVVDIESAKVLRRAQILLRRDNRQRARQLAAYLASGASGQGVERVDSETTVGRAAEPEAPAPKEAEFAPVAVSPAASVARIALDSDAEFPDRVGAAPAIVGRSEQRVRRSGYAWWAAGTGVLAVGAVVTGLYLVQLDGSPSCNGGIAQCPNLHATAPAGYAVLAGGSALAVASGVFTYAWWSSGSRTKVIAMMPFGDGVMATWGGRF